MSSCFVLGTSVTLRDSRGSVRSNKALRAWLPPFCWVGRVGNGTGFREVSALGVVSTGEPSGYNGIVGVGAINFILKDGGNREVSGLTVPPLHTESPSPSPNDVADEGEETLNDLDLWVRRIGAFLLDFERREGVLVERVFWPEEVTPASSADADW